MEEDRRPLIYGIVIILIIAGIAGWYYYKNKKAPSSTTTTTETKTTVSNLTNMDPTDFDSAVKAEYALAVAKAAEVKSDYKISQIEVNLGADLMTDSINTRYVFSAPSDTANNWLVTINATSQNYIRASIPKSDYAGNIAPLDTTLWKYNYVTALQLAEKNGGLDWRNSNTLTGLTETLKTDTTKNLLVWSVVYASSSNSKTIILDATSGKVVE